jgi:hypothetical protein
MMNAYVLPSPFYGGRGRGWGSSAGLINLFSETASTVTSAAFAPKTPIPCPFPHKRGKGEC